MFRPSPGGSGRSLACPVPGSFLSLEKRYSSNPLRFTTKSQAGTSRQLFAQQPKPRFVQVAYESPPSRYLFELQTLTDVSRLRAWPLARASALVVMARDGAVERLRAALAGREAEIERFLVGRKPNGADAAPAGSRVRVVPLPSIGLHHADRAIRRLLVDVPAGCALRAGDVRWAFSGLELVHPDTGEVMDIVLSPTADDSMLAHYGIRKEPGGYRVWRTVTPAALPESARRRRIDPARALAEAKGGREHAAELARASAALAQALRHAEVRAFADTVRLQREPFEGRGERVETFAPGTRFEKHRLWHVEIAFREPITGPLVIGDGRFLGLGVMAPVRHARGVHAFVIEGGLSACPDPTVISRALRRAVMARVRTVMGPRAKLPAFFSGHERDGTRARRERHPHLTFTFDPCTERLLIIAPHVMERRTPSRDETGHLEVLGEAVRDLREIRSASHGRMTLGATFIDADADPLFATSCTWTSLTPYQVTRHAKRGTAETALVDDVLAECRRGGLPAPRVKATATEGVPGVGLVGMASITFEVAIPGPVVLGKSRHLGGGLFAGGGR